MEGKKFYDIHCHAFNLSHPNLLAFLTHFKVQSNLLLGMYFIIGPLLPFVLNGYLKKTRLIQRAKNTLAVMENDVGSQFLLMEECIRGSELHLFKNGGLELGGNRYEKMILTPLLIDFGYKNMQDPEIHYHKPPEKPIVEQVIDVFNGIKKYGRVTEEKGFFEIYPFLGLNPRNYTTKHIERMLDKYFGEYQGVAKELQANLGQFTGDINDLESNFFSGIKVYPLLGYNPWPEDAEELKKVQCLYEYCESKQIPITSHCADQGFVVISKREVKSCINPTQWGKVLKAYPRLKLNLAHFGSEKAKTKPLLQLVKENENVYLDFSYIAFQDGYYRKLKDLLLTLSPEERGKVTSRLLFGSDFTMSLLEVGSYSEYLHIFGQTKYLSSEEKDCFCSTNPEMFLFQSSTF